MNAATSAVMSAEDQEDDALFVGRQELADEYGVSYSTMGRMLKRHRVHTYRKPGAGNIVRYRRSEVDEKMPRKWRAAGTENPDDGSSG